MYFSTFKKYALGLSFLAIAIIVRIALGPWLGSVLSHPTVFTAVLLTTWYSGLIPGVLVAVLGYPAIEYLVLHSTLGELNVHYLIPSLGLYIALNGIIIGFVDKFRRERDELRATEGRLSVLSKAVESAANSIVLTDHKGSIIWVNPAFTELTGYSAEEAVGQNPKILKSGNQPPDFYKELWGTILRGDQWHGQLVNRRKDGSLYHEEMTIAPVRAWGASITHYIGIKENITERKELEDALRDSKISSDRAKQAAEQANQAKDQFLAVLSHELRTPLAPVLASVQLMQRTCGTADDMGKFLDIIRRNVQLEARLIDDLLDLSRIVSGKIVLHRKPFNIASVIQRAIETCKPDLEARRLVFDARIADEFLIVDGDISRLQQVFWNLLKNSIKFTPDDGSVSICCRGDRDKVIIEVLDSGIGIEPEDLSRIFNAFEQGDSRTTRQFGGLGLGLAITKRLVEMHGGTISAHSMGKGRGATFRVSLPRTAEPPAEAEADKTVAVSTSIPRRILLVEDHGDSAATMQALLESSGYEVETAGDVAQARAVLRKYTFDLLISDLGLPDGSGLELMQEIRRGDEILKGIALSGYGREEDVRRSSEVGFQAHLTKPVDFDILIRTVERVLQGKAAP